MIANFLVSLYRQQMLDKLLPANSREMIFKCLQNAHGVIMLVDRSTILNLSMMLGDTLKEK
jgi:hypothetical protein